MGVFRSYIKKNVTLIDNNLTNNSQNPVSEISYGTVNKQVSRLIFDLDLNPLINRINAGHINPQRIVKHTLHLTNTIQHAEEYVGKKSYSLEIDRASSFDLEVFNVNEDWDEGSGYDFVYNDNTYPQPQEGASNWFYRKTNTPWTISGGSYQSGITEIFGTQNFEKGDEDLEIDITDYINGRLGLSGFTGNTFGLGVKFPDYLEELETNFRQAVAFHVKNTHTFYEPYVETVINDNIIDDRNYFYQDKDNNLILYTNQDVDVNFVDIFDHEEVHLARISGDSIIQVSKGVYSILYFVDSDIYPDGIIFKDVWNVNLNGRNKDIENQYYIISSEKYYGINNDGDIDLGNYSFYFWGIKQQEKIVAGDLRKIRLTVRELYSNQDDFLPLEIEYRIFITVGENNEIDVIPYTSVNRTNKGYEFNLDTSWMIPQDYYIQLRLKNGDYYEEKERVKFTIVSNTLKK